jgi:ATP-dependent helicase/nuclease subunit A
MEAGDAAALCKSIIAGGWEVCDPGSGAVRPAQYRDIALLMPTRNVLIPLERALADAGIPYRVEGGSLVYRTQEVRDLINCLSAIDDPSDEVAVVAALRSPAFACSDVELAQHRAAGGRFDYSQDKGNGDVRVREALSTLASYHARRHNGSLAALVERFVAERLLVETGILDQGDRNSFRRMRFVVEQARSFEAGGPESLREFVLWLERRGDQHILDNEGAGLDDDEDSVRILTIHGAKGLEFPIVLMVGMGSYPNDRPSGAYLADHASGDLAVCVGHKGQNRQFRLGNWDQLRLAESAHASAEFARLLYVAATRARDHLLFSLYRKGEGIRTAAGILESNGATDIAARIAPSHPDSTRRPPLEGLEVDPPGYASAAQLESRRLELVSSARRRRYTSATAEVRETREEGSEKRDEEDSGEPWARGRGGTRLGRAVHAAIQSLPLDADEEQIRAFSRAQAVAEAIPHRTQDVAGLVQAALSSEAAARARSSQRAQREVAFAVQSGDITLEGFADMVIETDEGLEIVDWKTDQISPGELDARLEEYRLQAGLYVWGLESATGLAVSRVTYVFAALQREVAPGDPAGLAEYAMRHLSAPNAHPGIGLGT